MGILASELQLHVIRPTLKAIELWSEAAENLLLGTAAQESHLGRYLTQIRGPALGIYQMEPGTHQDIWWHYLRYRPELAKKVKTFAASNPPHRKELVTNLAYATVMTRIYYLRVKEALPHPNDIQALAQYWKRYYNTFKGKGKIEEFILNYQELVL